MDRAVSSQAVLCSDWGHLGFLGQSVITVWRLKMLCMLGALVAPWVPEGSWWHRLSSCPVLPGCRGAAADWASGSLCSYCVSIALFHKQSDPYFDSSYVFFETPISISGCSMHPFLHRFTVLLSTICCKELVCQRDKMSKGVKEEAHPHCFHPTVFVGKEPGACQPQKTL